MWGVHEFKGPLIIFIDGGGGCGWKPMEARKEWSRKVLEVPL
jgi:hypothetical protein